MANPLTRKKLVSSLVLILFLQFAFVPKRVHAMESTKNCGIVIAIITIVGGLLAIANDGFQLGDRFVSPTTQTAAPVPGSSQVVVGEQTQVSPVAPRPVEPVPRNIQIDRSFILEHFGQKYVEGMVAKLESKRFKEQIPARLRAEIPRALERVIQNLDLSKYEDDDNIYIVLSRELGRELNAWFRNATRGDHEQHLQEEADL